MPAATAMTQEVTGFTGLSARRILTFATISANTVAHTRPPDQLLSEPAEYPIPLLARLSTPRGPHSRSVCRREIPTPYLRRCVFETSGPGFVRIRQITAPLVRGRSFLVLTKKRSPDSIQRRLRARGAVGRKAEEASLPAASRT